MLQAFHNDQAIKDKYLARVIAHQKADNLIRGTGWRNGKGCAVGCTLENYDHSRYPIELGIPEWVARVEDTLFEGMSKEKSRTWPEIFLRSVPVGLTERQFEVNVKAPFLVYVLESTLRTFDHDKFPDIKTVIDRSIALWKRNDIGSDDFIREAVAAQAAAVAARAALNAAVAARAALNAAWAAEWAAWAALNAAGVARAVWDAAWAAWDARDAKFNEFAVVLINLIINAGE